MSQRGPWRIVQATLGPVSVLLQFGPAHAAALIVTPSGRQFMGAQEAELLRSEFLRVGHVFADLKRVEEGHATEELAARRRRDVEERVLELRLLAQKAVEREEQRARSMAGERRRREQREREARQTIHRVLNGAMK